MRAEEAEQKSDPFSMKPPADEKVDAIAVSEPSKESKPRRGLSELSKQLRVLQAKNQSQSNEIDRLERQLKLLSDLKGISVADLRSALKTACKGEAHADLQNQIASLQAQLEAKALANTAPSSSGDFEKEASCRAIATFQLRVGELEEVEESLRAEMRNLYQSLSEQTSKSTRLESTCAKLREELDQKVTPATPTAIVEYKATSEVEERARMAELEVQVQQNRVKVLEQQINAREKESELRNEQFKSRFKVQDERIFDLEQQLTSLYLAFEMMRQEHTEENESRATLQTNLYQSDHEVARQLQTRSLPGLVAERIAYHEPPPASPKQVQPPQDQPSSPLGSPNSYHRGGTQEIAGGYMWKWDKNILKGWKKRYFVLLGGDNGVSELRYSEAPKQTVKGTFYITRGVSTVEETSQFGNKPHAFVLKTDPYDVQAPVLHAAAPTGEVLQQWLVVLNAATNGQEAENTEGEEESDLELALRLQMEMM